MQNIYQYLKNDHQKVRDLFEEIVSSKNIKKRTSLFDAVKKEILLHSESEKYSFYNKLKKYPEIKECVQHGDKEHNGIKDVLKKMSNMSPKDIEWLALFGELRYRVEHHVAEEEGPMFKAAKKFLKKEDAIKLVDKMEKEKDKFLESKDKI